MTRYIGEPSPEKKLAEGRALTESLARRPAPAGVVFEWGRAEFTTDHTVVSGITKQISWDTIVVPAGQTTLKAGSVGLPFQLFASAMLSVHYWAQWISGETWLTSDQRYLFFQTDHPPDLSSQNPVIGPKQQSDNSGNKVQYANNPAWFLNLTGSGPSDDLAFHASQNSGGARTLTQGGVVVWVAFLANPNP